MKIRNLEITNFKAIKQISIQDLSDTIVIAGPNGCGKSCIFDAIRLLKSLYGGHNQNEVQQWFGEFQIDMRTIKEDVRRILNDKTSPLKIKISFELDETERNYLRTNHREIIEKSIWDSILPEDRRYNGAASIPAADIRHHRPSVDARTVQRSEALMSKLDDRFHVGEVLISPDGEIRLTQSPVLEVCFTVYDPKNIGLIDYHSAGRTYDRETIGGINLNIETSEQRMKNHALYNWANKYKNVKSEMAGSYIRELLAKEANVELGEHFDSISTLQELFRIFFPGKSFLGPQPTADGQLNFPVELDDGSIHDINELSSGEKEVLYGYLRIQNTSPRNSILLLDEPELHLNPRLIMGLPKFYQKHLGAKNNNQLWLITHSDTMLRETVGEPDFSVFHMRSSINLNNQPQIEQLNAQNELEAVFIDLVGDLAAFSPSSKVVIFEGGGDSDFDVKLVSTLFPSIVEKLNLISGENKTKVRALHKILTKAAENDVLPYKFFSIVDKDSENTERSEVSSEYKWDVYHIENYLIEPKYIRIVANDIRAMGEQFSESDINDLLRQSADNSLNALLVHELRIKLNAELMNCISLGINPETSDVADEFYSAIDRSHQRLQSSLGTELSLDKIHEHQRLITQKLSAELASGDWIKTFRGRDILRNFVSRSGLSVSYEMFRNLIISRMRDDGYEPEGMRVVLNNILEA